MHFVPFVIFNIYILGASFYPEIAVKLNIEKLSSDFNPPLLFLFFLIITAFSGTVYFLFTIKLFRKLDINIFNNFSNSKNINLGWLRRVVFIFGIIWTVLMIITTIHHVFHMFLMVFCTDGLFLSMSVFVILIGYYGLKQKVIFFSESLLLAGDKIETQEKYGDSRLKDSEAKQYVEKLDNYMALSKPFLNPDLTLLQLATDINIKPHLLSQIINDHYKLNFFDYINQYRVQEFKVAVTDPKIRITHFSELLLNVVSIQNRLLTGCLKNLPGLLLPNSKRPSYKSSTTLFLKYISSILYSEAGKCI